MKLSALKEKIMLETKMGSAEVGVVWNQGSKGGTSFLKESCRWHIHNERNRECTPGKQGK